jgi:hypothetical protein
MVLLLTEGGSMKKRFAAVRRGVNTKLGAAIAAAGLAALLTAGALNFQYVNDRITGGPSLQAQTKALAADIANDVAVIKGVEGQVAGQSQIGAFVDRTGCGVSIVNGLFLARVQAEGYGKLFVLYTNNISVGSAPSYVVVPYTAATGASGFLVVGVSADCP